MEQEIDTLARILAPTGEEQNQPGATPIWYAKGTVTAAATSTSTVTVQFASSTDVPTTPVAGIHYLNRPTIGDVVIVAVIGPARFIVGAFAPTNQIVPGYLQAGGLDMLSSNIHPPFRYFHFYGTTNGSGAAIFSHGIANFHKKVGLAQCFYRGNSGEMLPMTFTYIDGADVVFTGGVAGRLYRCTITYHKDDQASW